MQEEIDEFLLEAIKDIESVLSNDEERKKLVGSPPTKVIMFYDGLPYTFPIEEFKKRFIDGKE